MRTSLAQSPLNSVSQYSEAFRYSIAEAYRKSDTGFFSRWEISVQVLITFSLG